jgi:hypothetical protein
MPAKVKKPKIKVEEIKENPVVEIETVEVDYISSSSIPATKEASPLRSEEEVPTQVDTQESSATDTPAEVEETKTSSTNETEKADYLKNTLAGIRPDTSKEVEKSGGGFNVKLFFVFLLIFIILGALAGGVFYYKDRVSQPSTKPSVTPTVTKSVTPTPETSSKVDLSKMKVDILNGSGTPGEAGRVKILLLNAGFTDDNIGTGNADAYTYKSTVVSVSKDLSPEVYKAVEDALSSKYTVEASKETLSASSKVSVEIIVGKAK